MVLVYTFLFTKQSVNEDAVESRYLEISLGLIVKIELCTHYSQYGLRYICIYISIFFLNSTPKVVELGGGVELLRNRVE
jgi:hypothetical protein